MWFTRPLKHCRKHCWLTYATSASSLIWKFISFAGVHSVKTHRLSRILYDTRPYHSKRLNALALPSYRSSEIQLLHGNRAQVQIYLPPSWREELRDAAFPVLVEVWVLFESLRHFLIYSSSSVHPLQERASGIVVRLWPLPNRLGHVHVQSQRCRLHSPRCAGLQGTEQSGLISSPRRCRSRGPDIDSQVNPLIYAFRLERWNGIYLTVTVLSGFRLIRLQAPPGNTKLLGYDPGGRLGLGLRRLCYSNAHGIATGGVQMRRCCLAHSWLAVLQ